MSHVTYECEGWKDKPFKRERTCIDIDREDATFLLKRGGSERESEREREREGR